MVIVDKPALPLFDPSHFTADSQAKSDATVLSGVRKLLIINLTTRYPFPRARSYVRVRRT